MTRSPLAFALLLGGSLFFSACATTRVALDATADMPDYAQEIYLVAPGPEDDPRKVYPKVLRGLREAGFRVHLIEGDAPLLGRQGTAFALSKDGYFLTSGHLFDKETEATLWLNGERLEAALVKKDEELDLALLKLDAPPTDPITPLFLTAEPAYRLGTDVFTIGFPLSDVLGRQPRLNKGLISASVGMKDDPAFVQVTVATQPGNSGSPLFNEEREVIGLMQSTLNAAGMMKATGGAAPQNVNFALKAPEILAFLEGTDLVLADLVPEEEPADFETISQSVAQVRSGLISDHLLEANKLGCFVVYRSHWDFWHRFTLFQMILFDVDTQEIVFVAGQTGDNLFSTENVVIEKTIEEVQRKLVAAAEAD